MSFKKSVVRILKWAVVLFVRACPELFGNNGAWRRREEPEAEANQAKQQTKTAEPSKGGVQ